MAEHSGWPDCPADVRHQVEAFVAGVRDILEDNLAGVYLHGSLAMGCFNPSRSDVDLLVVTRQGMAVDTKRRIAQLLLGCSNRPRPIEIGFLSESMLNPWRHPAPFDFHFSEEWREAMIRQIADGRWQMWNDETRVDPDLAAHIAITLNRGVCLFGQPIASTFLDVPSEDYLDSIVSDFFWAKERLAADSVYFILNACRVLACLRDNLILSKAEGGEWGLQSLPGEFRPAIAWALAEYCEHPQNVTLTDEDLSGFAGYAARQLLFVYPFPIR